MKILVCTDGSKHSEKALQQASLIAESPSINEVAVIHVYDESQEQSPLFITSDKQEELVNKVKQEYHEERKKILAEAVKIFAEKNINVRTILKNGHPSHTIIDVAQQEGFDMIIIGSRGLGGLEQLFLGSVSNAVVHEAKKISVVVVK